MRIPRLAFAAMIAGIVALACTLAVVKVGANSNGTVVLLTTTGPNGRCWIAHYQRWIQVSPATGTER